MQTHESYIRAVASIVVEASDCNPSEMDLLRSIKLVYGAGPDGVRGITYFNRFKPAGKDDVVPFVEISAFNASSICQITGTTIHELGHVLAGWPAGHGKPWHDACDRLGLRRIKAAGTNYVWANLAPKVRHAVAQLELPGEGSVVQSIMGPGLGGLLGGAWSTMKLKPCGAGFGTRGGTSRGKGSGSRMVKYVCGCGQIIRAAGHSLEATHGPCSTPFSCE